MTSKWLYSKFSLLNFLSVLFISADFWFQQFALMNWLQNQSKVIPLWFPHKLSSIVYRHCFNFGFSPSHFFNLKWWLEINVSSLFLHHFELHLHFELAILLRVQAFILLFARSCFAAQLRKFLSIRFSFVQIHPFAFAGGLVGDTIFADIQLY